MHLGFIGFGHLGTAIAGRLLACNHTITAWNRTPRRLENLSVATVDSPAAVAKAVDLVFLCLFDSAAVDAVLNHDGGLLSGNVNGKVIVDLSTNHFDAVTAFYKNCRDAGAIYLESPVLGSVIPAAKGALTVLVSGDKGGYEQALRVLENIGQPVFYLKEETLATKMKLINNLALGNFMATLAEALSFGEEVGIAKKTVLDILANGGGQSLVLNAKSAKLQAEDWSTHFSSALIYKDLHCLQDLAYRLQKPLFTGAVAKELFGKTMNEGFGQEDFSAVYKLFKK
jgi:3-hydroxyisobutyrate dehydrogenase